MTVRLTAPFQEVVVKGFVDEVVILRRQDRRSASAFLCRGAFVADPLHYLALIEMKPNALDQAAALQNWDLPEVFQHLRHLFEARMGNKGKRKFIQVPRLLEAMPREVITYAVTEAIHLGAIGFDAVKPCGSASKAGPRPFRPQVVGTKPLSQIGWGFRSAPISTTLAAFGTVFEYVSTSR